MDEHTIRRGTSLEVFSIEMRKRIRIIFLAALVAAIVVPVAFALSFESSNRSASASLEMPIAQIRTTHTSLLASTSAAATALPDIPEGAKLFAIGTALFGVAAAMKRGSRHDVKGRRNA